MGVTGLIIGGLLLLAGGGEVLLRGATRLATLLGVSPLVIGLTVVAFGTSAPELMVSLVAAWNGAPEVALGNVVGSTTFNVLGVLGISALVAPLAVASRLVRIDAPIMAFAALLSVAVSLDGEITRLDGVYLFGGFLAYMAFCVREARRGDAPAVEAEFAEGVATRARGVRQFATSAAFILAGLAALVLGSRWLVEGAVAVARRLDVSEMTIGLTVVAVGTSLPEVAASVAAALRGQRDIAVGNVIGSNLFNLLAVLGLSGIVGRAPIPVSAEALSFDLPVMLAACLACLPVFVMGFRITRLEGAVLVGYYVAYAGLTMLFAAGSPSAHDLSSVMLRFVLPLTILAAAIAFVRSVPREPAP